VGLIVTDTGQPVFAEMVRGVEEVASQHGLTLLLANSAEDPAREAQALRVLAERRVDGLIIARSARSDPALLKHWRSSGTPVVLMDRLGDAKFDQVGADNAAAMDTLVSHLLDHGHRRVGLVAGNLEVATLAERREGYLAALDRHGVPVDQSLILTGTGRTDDAQQAALELLGRPDRPTALVTASTPMAAGALRAAAQLGLRIPADLAFAAFDNIPLGDLFSPPLTTVDQPATEIGREAMRMLLRRLEGPKAKPSTVRLSPAFNHRSSCCSESGTNPTPEPPALTVGVRKNSSSATSRRRAGTESKG